MASGDGFRISEASAERVFDATLIVENLVDQPERTKEDLGVEVPPSRVVMLLEEIASGGTGKVAILRKTESTETQILSLLGATRGGTFKLTFDSIETTDIAWNASASDVQAALEALSNLSDGDIFVEFGPDSGLNNWFVPRWLIQFTGQYTATLRGDSVPLITVSTDDLTGTEPYAEVKAKPDIEDTGETEDVWGVIPVGTPSPLRPGAIAVIIYIWSFGYVLIALECLNFFSTDEY